MESVAVIIATFGNGELWAALSERAEASVVNQEHPPTEIFRIHGPDLCTARNMGADLSTTDWLIFLDADDELDPYYIEKMLEGSGDIRQPSTLGIVNDVEDDYPVLIPPKANLLQGNHLVIGSMIRSELFEIVGGFRDLPVLEDWDLWIRCWLAGAVIRPCPEAVYRVHVNPSSRNQGVDHNRIYKKLQNEYLHQAKKLGLL